MSNKRYHYYVEGQDDKKVIDVLRLKMGLIESGRVDVLNVVTERITDLRLRTLTPGTIVVLVFDTDAGNRTILEENIRTLNRHKNVKEVITIPQVSKLEDELVRSCNIRQIKELLNSKTNDEFKHDVLGVSNLDAKLRQHQFDINKFWTATPPAPYQNIPNQAAKVKK